MSEAIHNKIEKIFDVKFNYEVIVTSFDNYNIEKPYTLRIELCAKDDSNEDEMGYCLEIPHKNYSLRDQIYNHFTQKHASAFSIGVLDLIYAR